jgi:hypothetical protein
MTGPANENITFYELAKRVIEKEGKPMTAREIWEIAQQSGIASQLRSTGLTPEATLGALLYREVQNPKSIFSKLGSRPAKFLLKSIAGSIPDLQQQEAVQATPKSKRESYAERDVHPLLVWFADRNFGAQCQTIFHERSLKKGDKQNQWIHPDIVGVALTSQDWTHEVVQLAQSSGALPARLYSFELKISLDFPTLREFFFQAVSNSSWANEGYLVAVDIDEDPEFRAELTRLSQSFGIGVIQLSTKDFVDCSVLVAARERHEIDWKTVDRIAAVNPDFKKFVNSVANSVKINQPAFIGFDQLMTDAELEIHLAKIVGK